MAAFTKDQYAFIVEQLAEGDDAHNIAAAFKLHWKQTPCTIDDVAEAYRDLGSSGWKAYHDAHRTAFETNEPLARREFRIAFLGKLTKAQAARGAVSEAAKNVELIEKIDSGFYSGKGKTEPAAAPDALGPVTSITRTVVDPAPVTE